MTTWTQNDVTSFNTRPGGRINFTSLATLAIKGGITGTVAMVVHAPWGPVAVQEITTTKQITDYYNDNDTGGNNAYTLLRLALAGGPSKLLVYRVVGPTAAKGIYTVVDTTGAPVNVITLTGKYFGARTDSWTITIANNPENTSRKDVSIIEGGVTLIKWTTRVDDAGAGMMQDLVDQINADTANFYVDAAFIAEGNGTLAAVTGAAWGTEGIDDTAAVVADYDEAMAALELEDFELIHFDVDISEATGIITSIAAWLNTTRNSGKKIVWVTGSSAADTVANAQADAQARNHEGIIYVHPGIKINNLAGVETTYAGYLAAARVAGIIAGLPLSQSATFRPITNINDLEFRRGDTDIKALLGSGVLPLVYDGTRFKIERALNTLTTPSAIQSDTNRKIRPVRILDNINNALVKTINSQIIGRVNNNATGRNTVLQLIEGFLATQVRSGLIEETFTVVEDPDNPPTLDRFFVKIGITPVDAIEYMFITIEVS